MYELELDIPKMNLHTKHNITTRQGLKIRTRTGQTHIHLYTHTHTDDRTYYHAAFASVKNALQLKS